MKTLVFEREAAIEKAAEHIKALIREKPNAVLALDVGAAVGAVCDKLVQAYDRAELSLSQLRIFSLTEYEEPPPGKSCRETILCGLVNKTDAEPANCRFIGSEGLEAYDGMIAEAGGVDICLLGLGLNASIGFNEPAVPFASPSHRQKLTDITKRRKAPCFGGEDKVPGYGYTLGIKTIVSSRETLVIALGPEKAEAVFKMLYGRNDSAVPAAFLQISPNVTIYLDKAAAEKL